MKPTTVYIYVVRCVVSFLFFESIIRFSGPVYVLLRTCIDRKDVSCYAKK